MELSIIISFIALIISLINLGINGKQFLLNKRVFFSTNQHLLFVEKKEFEEKFQIKLVLYNPSSTRILIHCVKMYVCTKDYFDRAIPKKDSNWEQLEIEWWPSDKNEDFTNAKFLHQGYKDLLVEDFNNIYIQTAGNIKRNRYYKFEVVTSFDSFLHITKITSNEQGFHIDYKKKTKTTDFYNFLP